MRKHYIDNLRWMTVLLLIPYHAAQAFNTWDEPNYIYFSGNRLFSSVIVFFSPFFMPLMFLLAGISTRYALKKRTYKQYISERTKRLAVPLIFGLLTFVPAMTYLAHKYNYGYDGGFFEHYGVFFSKLTDFTGADGGFSLGQFWFLLYLFVISLIAVGIIALQRKFLPKERKAMPLWGILLLGLPLPLLSEVLSVSGKSVAEYLYIFLIGYYVFSKDEAVEASAKYAYPLLGLGLAVGILNVYLFIWSGSEYPTLNTVTKFLTEWIMIVALMGIGKRKLDFSGRVPRLMSRWSFPFFSFHFIWVILFQYLLSDIFTNNTLLYFIPVISGYICTFVCSEICCRVPPLAFLTGTKTVKNK